LYSLLPAAASSSFYESC